MKLSSLYYPGGGEEKYKLFLKRNEERILSLLPPSLSLELSLFHLKGGELRNRRLFEDLGLINGLSVTERGKRILSAYPLFGSGREKRGNYSSSFFPFLFSLVASSSIPRRYERFLSSPTFLSLFPWRDEESLTSSSSLTISSLIKLGVIKDNSSYLSLNMPSALLFMKMDEMTKLSYILSSSSTIQEREKTKNFISISFLINGVKKEEIENTLGFISEITKTSIALSSLLSFGIITENSDSYTGTQIEEDIQEKGVVSPDMTVSYRGKSLYPFWRFASPLKADSLNQWSITKKSIKAAFDGGMKKEDILSYLSLFSSSPLSPVIEERLNAWSEEYNRITIERAVVMETDDRVARIIKMIPQIQDYIISNPSPNLFIMDGEKEEEWREILSTSGFDMLSLTKGPEFSSPLSSDFLLPLPPSPSLPFHRDVEFEESEYQKTLNNSKTFLQKSFVSSHAVFSSKTELKLEWIDGLEYREKRDKVLSAISDEDNIIIMWVDETMIITKPLSLEEREEVEFIKTEDGDFELGKIWMVTQVPSYVRALHSDPSGSDNQ